ncbi:hypothetical protein N7468_005005 [Penicillium chermesinum]|uniref:Uncharacterized protein n=1 Tax=Penicillium chermesinum TaxID=63820 RepID=A0A9W9NYD5_9EURO|nr:uncharacterized protein N7468_005005 [Penicillium chermesinum]KAJ5232049.1 hypothetical protein N7468_005005 [Penicillium chermesinum]
MSSGLKLNDPSFQQIEDELALIHVQASQNSLVFTSDIKDLKEKLHSTELKLQAAENKLEATEKELEKARHQLGHHDLSFEMVLDLREIIFSTALRLHSASLHLNTNKFLLYQGAVKPVQAPSSLKGGYAAMDAILILERQHIDWLVPFMRIYGVDASVVKEIAEAGHARILRVLNAVGTYRLAGKLELDEGEKEVFEEMVHMIDFKRMEAASDLSRQFPFKKLAFSMDGME